MPARSARADASTRWAPISTAPSCRRRSSLTDSRVNPGAARGKRTHMSSTDNLRWSEPNDATPFLPERRSLTSLREAAAGCRGCDRWRKATQTVFGEGRRQARLMFVGEVPGDREDREGRPFVGPAGRELDKALE